MRGSYCGSEPEWRDRYESLCGRRERYNDVKGSYSSDHGGRRESFAFADRRDGGRDGQHPEKGGGSTPTPGTYKEYKARKAAGAGGGR